MNIDITSLLLGFLVGLVVFQAPYIKRVLEALGTLGILLFMLALVNAVINKNLETAYISNMTISFILGNLLSSLVYLVGANISRYVQFGELSPRILIYIALIMLILMILAIS